MPKKNSKRFSKPSSNIGEEVSKAVPNAVSQRQRQESENFNLENLTASLSQYFDCTKTFNGGASEIPSEKKNENTGKCSYCNTKKEDLKKCIGCKAAFYCDRKCQTADWSRHKEICRKDKKDDNTVLSVSAVSSREKERKDGSTTNGHREDSSKTELADSDIKAPCFNCETSKENLLKCAQCKTAVYCDRQCQKAHWPDHKYECKLQSKKEDSAKPLGKAGQNKSLVKSLSHTGGNAGARGNQSNDAKYYGAAAIKHTCLCCKKSRQTVTKCPVCKIAEYCDYRCQRNHHLEHKAACANYPKFFSVLEKTSDILTDYHDCTSTEIVYPPLPSNPFLDEFQTLDKKALLLEIVEPFPHLFRHAVFVQDVNGERAAMIFYHDKDEELALLPRQLGGMLTPGNFIRWFEPHWHSFLDGMVGFRINTLEEIEVLQKSITFTVEPINRLR